MNLPIFKELNVCDTLLFADDINHHRSYEEKTPMIEQKLNEYLQKIREMNESMAPLDSTT
jgi:septin family protein